MGLRCLLGHDYGDPELERDRDEQGEEVVVTIREVATCTRCGAERVVSENKEVTSIASPAEIEGLAADDAHDAEVVDADGVTMGGDQSASAESAVETEAPDAAATSTPADAADSTDSTDTPATPADGDADVPETTDADAEGGAEIIDETTDEEHTPTADEVEAPVADAEPGDADDGPSAEEDDGVILDADEESESGERGHGEWPEADDVNDGPPEQTPTIEEVRGEDDATAATGAPADGEDSTAGDETRDAEVVSETEPDRAQWPEQVGDDEGFDAEPSDGSATDVEFGGIAPESDSQQGDSPEDVETVEDGFDAEFVDNGSEASRAANGAITRATAIDTTRDSEDVPTEYVCPECGLRRPASGSSMREGDICPECKRGYIAEEPR
ncbi:DUF7093 family protein [Salinirubrum litoreum]|uniref:Oxidoreductase n=1 Tax=Salinirubrum litoreum TaxID=1126234 RepID=A0ABD5REU1_9EURY|nr:hypothetical protein [Salinirubrum litoreum]